MDHADRKLTPELCDYMIPHMIDAWADGDNRGSYERLAELRFASGVAEEAGEFMGAYHRWCGLARRNGSRSDVESELADVIICATVFARVAGIDINQAVSDKLVKVLARGWKEGA